MEPVKPISVVTDSDQTVIGRVLGGNRAEFEVLIRRYNQRLFRVARSILNDDAEAEDAVQTSYLSAYSKLSQFRGDATFATWLTRITVYQALRVAKKKKRESKLELSDVALVQSAAQDADPEIEATKHRLKLLLEAAINALPQTYRVVFVMRDVEELSTKEVADCLDLSEAAVRIRLHRARRSLREHLYEQADVLSQEAFSFAGARCDRIVAGVLAKLVV